MYYYLVDKIGNGTKADPLRPNYIGSYVWGASNSALNNTYLIGLPDPTDQLQPVTDLEKECLDRNLNINDVLKWFAGD